MGVWEGDGKLDIGVDVDVLVGLSTDGGVDGVTDGSGWVINGVIVGKEKSSGVGNPSGVPVGVTF